MKIGTQLTAGFFVIALLVGISGYISLSKINEIAKPLNKEIPQDIQVLSEASYLDGLAQFIRYYDEVLTQSARNYAFTKDKKWKDRYDSVVPELDKIINEAINKGDEEDKKFFSDVNEANLALVDMEVKSFELTDSGNTQEAIKILESGEYWKQKNIYEGGLKSYVARRGLEYNEALKTSTETLDSAVKNAESLVRSGKNTVLIFVIGALLLAISLGFFVSFSIARPLRELTKIVENISTGRLDTQIDSKLKESNNELGQLAQAFDRTIISLKLAMKKTQGDSKKDEEK